MKNLILISILPFLFRVQSESTLVWSQKRDLVWSDFQGVPIKIKNVYAVTSYSHRLNMARNKDTLTVSLVTYFKKQESWVIDTNKKQTLLEHERTHFNIAELYARKTRRQLTETKFDKGTFKVKVNSVRDQVLSSLKGFQDIYDKETDLSRNKIKQKEWAKKINNELKLLDKYSDTLIKVLLQ